MLTISLVAGVGLAYWNYGYESAEETMTATCAQTKPGMSFAELRDFAQSHGLRSPNRQSGYMYLAKARSFGRHAWKVIVEQGAVVHAEHNYAD